jgi:hypothetical protein
MKQEITLFLNGSKQVILIFSETFKNWTVWRVQFRSGEESVLFKCGGIWMQRNEDGLDHRTLNAIGEQIDHNLSRGHPERLSPMSIVS